MADIETNITRICNKVNVRRSFFSIYRVTQKQYRSNRVVRFTVLLCFIIT